MHVIRYVSSSRRSRTDRSYPSAASYDVVRILERPSAWGQFRSDSSR